METVLVTGGSGFIGSYCILHLLEAGYRVRATLRSLKRESEARAMLKTGGAEPGERLSFVAADLLSDAGWPEAVAGCAYVLHVASPFPTAVPKNEDELILPAREGALRVLRAARDAGVRRVVLTSSFAAVGYGPLQDGKAFNEESWTDPDHAGNGAYIKSKTFAERAAWDFLAREGGTMELTTVNPVGVFGPILAADTSASIEIVRRMLAGSLPACPNMAMSIVDVRDVADLHLRAMTQPAAKGERFLAVSGEHMTLVEMARLFKEKFGPAARRVPTGLLPDWMVRLVALFDPAVAQIVPELGRFRDASHDKATRLLGWTPRSREEAVLASAESLLRLGVVTV